MMRAATLSTLLLLFLPVIAKSQEMDVRRVEAAFLSNFTHYIRWPESSFSDDNSPWHICVLGNDPFGDVLENTFYGRKVQGRTFEIYRINNPQGLQQCHIAYIAYKLSVSRRAAIAELNDLPILTVSNSPDFLQEGGMIRFDAGEHVAINVNLDQVRAASLFIQTKVLEISREVIINGKIRKSR